MMKKILFFGMLLFAAMTASAQYVHIEMDDGTKYDLDAKKITTMKMDMEEPVIKVEGTVTIGGKTYTRTVGGTVGKAVDLGLPSGTLWADHNVGATNPEDYGAYIAWAEVGAKEEGYVDGIKMKDNQPYYDLDNLKYYIGISSNDNAQFTKYVTISSWAGSFGTVDNKEILESIDDAATVNWGGDWKMPNHTQMKELNNTNYTTWTMTTRNGVNGYEVKSNQNGNSIFLPAAGIYYDNIWYSCNFENGYYWSSSLETNISSSAILTELGLGYHWSDMMTGRSEGLSIRPVCSNK